MRWRDSEAPSIRNFKATPLMIRGVLYLNTPLSVGAASEALTGESLWIYNPKSYEKGTTTMTNRWNQRGSGVLGGWGGRAGAVGNGRWVSRERRRQDRPARLRLRRRGPSGSHARSSPRGEGRARLAERAHLLGPVSSPRRSRHGNRAGIDLLLQHQERADTRLLERLRCAQRKVEVGVPHYSPAAELGNETWEEDSWSSTGKVSVWSLMSADEELGYLYLPKFTSLAGRPRAQYHLRMKRRSPSSRVTRGATRTGLTGSPWAPAVPHSRAVRTPSERLGRALSRARTAGADEESAPERPPDL